MRRVLVVLASTVVFVAAGSGAAVAATGQVLCMSAQSPVTGPDSMGHCKAGQTAVTVAKESEVTTLQGQVATLQGQVSALQSAKATLTNEVAALTQKLSKVTYSEHGVNGQPTLRVSGANLQVVNGTGQTAANNGVGNLILGYDENPGTQTGSHNIVLGYSQTFTSFGGIMGGWNNTLSGPDSLVFGVGDTASGVASAVTSGFVNEASGFGASISGGTGNSATDYESSVSGGSDNNATGERASVSGGEYNTASGDYSAVLGGDGVTVSATNGTSP
jgi:trimeric autotransporter adhesin